MTNIEREKLKKTNFKKHKISKKNKDKIDNKSLEMDKDLMEIYGDGGSVSDIVAKKRRPFILSLLISFFVIASLSLSAYWFFSYYNTQKESSFVLDLKIEAPSTLVLGQEFEYLISYKNLSRHELERVELSFNFPDNFIYTDSSKVASYNNDTWVIRGLESGESGSLKVSGFILNEESIPNTLVVSAGYEMRGFSSYFKRDFYHSINIGSRDFSLDLDFFRTALVGEEYVLRFSFSDFEPFSDLDMILSLSYSDNLIIESLDPSVQSDFYKGVKLESLLDNEFLINFTDNDLSEYHFYLKYRVIDRITEAEDISWQLKLSDDNLREYSMISSTASLDVIKSDLHLSLTINDSEMDNIIDFGDDIKYQLKYSNKSNQTMKGLVLMFIMEGDFIDLDADLDLSGGRLSGKTITWMPESRSSLRELGPGEEGVINFSIPTMGLDEVSFGQKFEIKAYSQFSIGNADDLGAGDVRSTDNRSNSIVSRFNSDFRARETIVYFNEDNIPVGSGPLPPRVGEKTSFRVSWEMENNLHELRDLRAEMSLPEYVNWDYKHKVSAGELEYDLMEHKIVWTLGRLPIGISDVSLEFNISIIPGELDYDKILVISNGSSFEAFDTETNSLIRRHSSVKTSILEDDSISSISSDGRIK